MPMRPLRLCRAAGCTERVVSGFCPAHTRAHEQRTHPYRHLYTSARWRRERAAFLRRHPLCLECHRNGQLVQATQVDHIIPHVGNLQAFWTQRNWQPLCESHHSAKTWRETVGATDHQRKTPANRAGGRFSGVHNSGRQHG